MFELENNSTWLAGVRRVPSPNCDARPADNDIDLLVIHCISLPPGEFGGDGIDRLFTNTLDPAAHPYYRTIGDLQVSAHVLVDRDGAVTQYVPFDQRAWHAGASLFCGRDDCNDFSIGIELEGCDDRPYAQVQYETLAQLTQLLMRAWPGITPKRIVGHVDIAPDRKTDPGPAFDWTYYRELLKIGGGTESV
jgi:N-acetyl-anhydromuramoyl-L-alanine amidase